MIRRHIVSALVFAGALLGPPPAPVRSDPDLLLPDLTTLESYMDDARVRRKRGRLLLFFPVAIYNRGRGPIEMLGTRAETDAEMHATQVVYDGEGARHEFDIGGWEYHDPHQHWHVLAVADYRLFNDAGQLVANSPKVSYFLEDTKRVDLSLPGTPRKKAYRFRRSDRSRTTRSLRTGISVGWADIYDTSVPGQTFDVTDLPKGTYRLEVEVNPERSLMESDYSNNVISVLVRI